MGKRFVLAGFAIALLSFAALTVNILALEVGETVPVACTGECSGHAWGFAESEDPCDQLTQAQKDQLLDDACDDAEARMKPTARDRANEVCLQKDNTGTCLCTGGTFSTEKGTTRPSPFGPGCLASCKVIYTGECNPVAAPEPL